MMAIKQLISNLVSQLKKVLSEFRNLTIDNMDLSFNEGFNHSVTSFDLNHSSEKGTTDIKALLTKLSSKHVDLSAIHLFSKTNADLKDFFSKIRKVNSLDLSDTGIYKKKPSDFKDILSGSKTKIDSIYLSFNELDHLSGAELKELVSILLKDVSFADLSYNNLSHKRGSELKEGFSGFSPSLRKVKLSRNGFPDQPIEKLEEAFSGFPVTLTSVDFSDDKSIKHLSDEQLLSFLRTIPQTVLLIDLSHNKLFKGKTEKEREALLLKLKEIDPSGTRLNLAHNGQPILAETKVELKRQPRELAHSILHLAEKRVSDFSFFGSTNSHKDKPAEPISDFTP